MGEASNDPAIIVVALSTNKRIEIANDLQPGLLSDLSDIETRRTLHREAYPEKERGRAEKKQMQGRQRAVREHMLSISVFPLHAVSLSHDRKGKRENTRLLVTIFGSCYTGSSRRDPTSLSIEREQVRHLKRNAEVNAWPERSHLCPYFVC